MVDHIEERKRTGESSLIIFGAPFETVSAVVAYYGAMWTKQYDSSYDAVYYTDHVTGNTQWDRPYTYDESTVQEKKDDKARETLKKFYMTYNPEKLHECNHILTVYKNNYNDLFIRLAEKYKITDLCMFQQD